MARYVTLGPFAFKQSKKSKSVRTLKPVKSQAEARRAFRVSGQYVRSSAASRDADRARLAAKKEAVRARKAEAARLFYGLSKRGRNNAIEALLSGESRLTTPQERAIRLTDPRFPSSYVDTKNNRVRPVRNRMLVDDKGTPLHAYGSTTPDEFVRSAQRLNRVVTELKEKRQRLERKHFKAENTGAPSGIPIATTTGGDPEKTAKALKKVTDTLAVLDPKGPDTAMQGFIGAMENLSRPYYGTMGGAKAIVKGERPDHVVNKVGRGLALKDRTEAWDVVEAAGVKNKYLKYGLGIPASFAGDPLTYISLLAAPETGGASLAALGPKAAKLDRLVNKAEKLEHAGKAGKAADVRAKAWELVDKHGMHSAPLGPAGGTRRGVSLRVGARIPLTQKFIGVQTSGKTSARIARSLPGKGVKAQTAKKNWQNAMSPTGTRSNMTNAVNDDLVHAAAVLQSDRTRAVLESKMLAVGARRALAREGGISRTERFFHPRRTRRKVDQLDEALFHRREAGTDAGKVTDDLDAGYAELRRLENEAGIPTRKFVPESAEDAQKYNYRRQSHQLDPKAAKQANRVAELEPVAKVNSRKNPMGAYLQGRKLRRRLADLDKPTSAESSALRRAERDLRVKEDAHTVAQRHVDERGAKATTQAISDAKRAEAARDDAARRLEALRKEVADAVDARTPVPGDPFALEPRAILSAAKRRHDSIIDVAYHKVNMAIKRSGQQVERDFDAALPHGQHVYEYDPRKPQNGFKKVDDVANRNSKAEHYVLSDAVLRRAEELTSAGPSSDKLGAVGRGLDKAQGHWKGSVTVWWPGYYMRNLTGDTILARQAGTSTRDLASSLKVMAGRARSDYIKRHGHDITKGKDPDAWLKRMKVRVNGKTYSGAEIERLAKEEAAIGSGLHGSEIQQRVGASSRSVTNPANRANVARENLPRRATFIAAMRRGDSPQKAAAFARREHYDYGLRTDFQKQMRRAVPFFSWLDLNTRKQMRLLATNPGKTLHIYRVMQAAAQGAGFDSYQDYLSNLQPGQQKALPIPVKVNGRVETIQFGNVLSELGVLSGPKAIAQKLGGSVSPLKAIAEIPANYSFFYNDKIEQEGRGKFEPAPVKGIPRALWGTLGIREKQDRKTGKMIPMWRKKQGYAIRALGPWPNLLASQLSEKGPRGQYDKTPMETLLGLTGISPSPYFPEQARRNKLYDEYFKLDDKANDYAAEPNRKELRKPIYERQKKIAAEIQAIEKKMGYKEPFGQSGPAAKGGKLPPGVAVPTATSAPGAAATSGAAKPTTGGGRAKPTVKLKGASVSTKPKLGANNTELRRYARAVAVKAGIDPNLFEAQIQQESGFNTASVSSAGAQGIAQIMPGTARSWGVNPNNPKAALKAAATHMAAYTRQYGSYDKALIAYNAGPGAVGRKQLPGETTAYIANINSMARRASGGKPIAGATSLKGDGAKIASKYGLKVTSTWRSKAHNAEVGGVSGSYHTRGSKAHPKAMDLVGSMEQMKRAAVAFRKKGYDTLIHNAGSGVHLHVQDDKNVGGLGTGGGTTGGGGGSYAAPSQSGSTAPSDAVMASAPVNPLDTQAGRMAAYEYLTSKKKNRSQILAAALRQIRSETSVL